MISLPTNGALMTRAQLDALGEYVRGGTATETERGLYHQIQAMLMGFEAINRAFQREQHCRQEAERKEGEIVLKLRTMQKIMQSKPSKATKKMVEGLLAQVMEEIERALEE